MSKAVFTFTLIIALMTACQPPLDQEQSIVALKTTEQQAAFLQNLHKLDQQVRNFETEQMQKFGYNSAAHLKAEEEINKIDSLNLVKLEAYLQVYGHPQKAIHGTIASRTPYLIIHHSIELRSKARYRYFPMIYRAYKNGDIDEGDLTFYLNRMHEIYLGYRIKWEGAYRVEQELDTLFSAMELKEIVAKVDAEWKADNTKKPLLD